MRTSRADRQARPLVRRHGPAEDAGTTRDVVMLHPGAMPVTVYRTLAERLARPRDGERPVALWLVDLDQVPEYTASALSGGTPRTSIREMAAAVEAGLHAAGALAPGAPWVLSGWSFGGVVAYELVNRLSPTELPRRLVVMDTIAPVPDFTKDDGDLSPELILPWFAMFLGAKRGVGLPLPEGERPVTLDDVLAGAVSSGALPPDTSVAGLGKVYQVFAAGLRRNNLMCSGFQAGPARVPVTLVRPDGSLLDTPEPLGWGQLTDDLAVVGCPGDHYSMFSDPDAVETVATVIREAAGTDDRLDERSLHHV